MKIDLNKNTMICGDNIKWLDWIPDESVDLCYIDPPFFSNATYEKIWGNGWEVASFEDRFAGGIEHYISWMTPRIKLIHKKLKKTGTIFLHCDWHASHRLRCLLSDIFGEERFLNEIIWQSGVTKGAKAVSGSFGRVKDHILFYSKTDKYTFNKVYKPHDLNLKHNKFRHIDKDGRIYSRDCPLGDYSADSIKKFEQQGRIYVTKNGKKQLIRYLDEVNGVTIGDLWTDIDNLNQVADERIGYKTQKPEKLLKRIIECSTNKNDIVLDCFSGGFTTAKVCFDLNRRFICGDVSPVACKIGIKRLNLNNIYDYEIKGLPQTEEEFREMDGHEFAETICDLMGWKCNPKKSNDKGIDGWDGNGNPIQIKNQKSKTGEKDVRNFLGSLHSSKNKIGFFVAWDFTPDAYEFVAREKNFEIHLRKCHELIDALLINNDKKSEIESLYKKRLPENWKKEEKEAS